MAETIEQIIERRPKEITLSRRMTILLAIFSVIAPIVLGFVSSVVGDHYAMSNVADRMKTFEQKTEQVADGLARIPKADEIARRDELFVRFESLEKRMDAHQKTNDQHYQSIENQLSELRSTVMRGNR